MVSGAKLWTSLTFIVSLVAASPLKLESTPLEERDASLLVGFRGVSKVRQDPNRQMKQARLTSITQAEADLYKKAGNFLVYDTTGGPSQRIDQLGPGAYLSPSPGEWPAPWVCAVHAVSASQFNIRNKAWVPEKTSDGKPLWDKDGGKAPDSSSRSSNDGADMFASQRRTGRRTSNL